jgi:hypothetical protein
VENRLVTRPLENGKRKWKIMNLRELGRTVDLLVYDGGFSLWRQPFGSENHKVVIKLSIQLSAIP